MWAVRHAPERAEGVVLLAGEHERHSFLILSSASSRATMVMEASHELEDVSDR